jgi:hypothetical protein
MTSSSVAAKSANPARSSRPDEEAAVAFARVIAASIQA